jgi:hypothetical protein
MTQYAVLIYAGDSTHALDATPEELAEADRHADDLRDSGAMIAAWALTPRELATSVRTSGVTDGPFIEAKEVVAGFYILEAPDLDAAIALARTNPVLRGGGGVEVRPIHSGGFVERDDR